MIGVTLASGSEAVGKLLKFAVIVCFSSLLQVVASDRTEFAYNGFDPEDGKIVCFQGSSFLNNKIQLTAVGAIQGMGRALYSNAVQFRDPASEAILSFSSQFIFSINPGSENLADGLAFVISPVFGGVENSSQGLLGIVSNTTNGQSSSHTFAVEFDAYKNPEFQDLDGNHVGIDINSVNSSQAVSAAYKTEASLQSANDGFEVQLKGAMIQAWIDYDANNTQLNVSVSPTLGTKPPFPLISNSSVNLSGLLQEHMYVGFSAATGPLSDVLYYIYAWSFSNNGSSAPVSLPNGSPAHDKKIAIILGVVLSAFAVVVSVLAVSFIYLRRRHLKPENEWNVDSLSPLKFSYRELRKATRGFHAQHLLGSGGFGSVYHGVLPSSGVAVAVKRMSKDSKQGLREFVAEVSTIGKLRHRNLVPLLGWCNQRGSFILVYELMPNGSLDKFLFAKQGTALTWAMRMKVLMGVASAMVYLHEECEQKIVHRDVKASNVMLDGEFNARLGDFGLARQSGHGATLETTNIAGTWGYLAPEYFYTRRATEKTDVFSYGALMLEVATGRRAAEMAVWEEGGGENVTMIEGLWRLRERGELKAAADERLGTKFDGEEMNRVLELGLLCCLTDPSSRPSMRRVLQILSGDVAQPPLPAADQSASSRAASFVWYSDDSTSNVTSSQFSSAAAPFGISDSIFLLRPSSLEKM